jgi:hypothetical protein
VTQPVIGKLKMTDEEWDSKHAEIMATYKSYTGRDQGAYYLVDKDHQGFEVNDNVFDKELRVRLDSNQTDPKDTKVVIL